MNNDNWRSTLSDKLKQLGVACAGLAALSIPFSATAGFVFSGGSNQALPIAGNDFNSQLQSRGFNQMTTGAQLSVDMNGFVDFYYIAAESGYTNSFHADSDFMTEDNDSFNFDGYDKLTIAVSAGDVLDFSFQSKTSSALTPVDNASATNLQGLGIMWSSDDSQLVLAYNDNPHTSGTGMDADYDDMLVRADFRSAAAVPVPAAVWLFGSGLLGLMGVARRKV